MFDSIAKHPKFSQLHDFCFRRRDAVLSTPGEVLLYCLLIGRNTVLRRRVPPTTTQTEIFHYALLCFKESLSDAQKEEFIRNARPPLQKDLEDFLYFYCTEPVDWRPQESIPEDYYM